MKQKGKHHDDGDRVVDATYDYIIILRNHELVNLVSDNSVWIIDNGSELHLTPRKKFFTSYTFGEFGVLKMGNDCVSKIVDIGDVCLRTKMRVHMLLRGVKHAPDVCFNLISLNLFYDDAYLNHFSFGKWKLTRGKLVAATGEKLIIYIGLKH